MYVKLVIDPGEISDIVTKDHQITMPTFFDNSENICHTPTWMLKLGRVAPLSISENKYQREI